MSYQERRQECDTLKKQYIENKRQLKDNLNKLLQKYQTPISEVSDALVHIRRAGYDMMNEVDSLYFPPFFVTCSLAEEDINNYRHINSIYSHANDLMASLLKENVNLQEIEINKNVFTIQINTMIAESSKTDRFSAAAAAFATGFIMLLTILVTSILVAAIAFLTPVSWAAIPLGLGGTFIAGLCVVRMAHEIEIAANTEEKGFDEFSNAVEKFVPMVGQARVDAPHLEPKFAS